MRRLILVLVALVISCRFTLAQSEPSKPRVQVSFVYPVGSSGFNSIEDTFHVSLNILAGATGGVEGLEMGGFANFTNGSVEGVQLAGFSNVVNDSVKGVQATGFANVTRGHVEGLQAAGFSNSALTDYHGAQVAGFANYTKDSLRGAQLAGFANVNTGGSVGLQAAGFTNYSMGARGTQIAGFANTNVGELKGNQLAGFANISTSKTEGVQIAGFINFARKIKGAQLGFINIADSIDGVAVGFFSFARNGYHQLELSANETFHTNLSFRTGTHHFYNVFSAAVRWNANDPVWAFGYGIGTRKEFKDKYALNAELSSYSVLPDNFDNQEWESLNKLQLSLAREIGGNLEVFAGASFNMWLSENLEPQHDYLPSKKYSGESGRVNWIMYPGFQFGIRI
ncbi:MAG: hypothetical protein JJ975_04210 [Bacteroidia bacterium]|nr:hypothetical protein [Bacteroidia bacterium]